MTRKYFFSILFLVAIILSGCGRGDGQARSEMLQVETFAHFASGNYDGVYPLDDLLPRTGFGIGTVDGLDGEMWVRGGQASRVTNTGKVVSVPAGGMVPFAMLCRFTPDTTFMFIPGEESLYEQIDRVMTDGTRLLAVEISGTFSSITTRSVARQQKPYKPLEEIIAADQKVFECGRSVGTALGFRIPAQYEAVNIPGYHIHYISDDRTHGGHVLEFEPESVTVSVQALDGLRVLCQTNWKNAEK